MFVRPSIAERPTIMQGSLLCAGEPRVPHRFEGAERFDLGKGAWLDWAPDWLPGSDEWFTSLRDALPWVAASRPMYERIVVVPRLLCSYPVGGSAGTTDAEVPGPVSALGEVFEAAYRRPLPRIGANWYRSGSDSVAPHADRVAFPGDSVVVIVAVGERRPFLLRPLDGGTTRSFDVGRGDVLVMGGTMQAFWQHGVPKVASSATRISLMFRST